MYMMRYTSPISRSGGDQTKPKYNPAPSSATAASGMRIFAKRIGRFLLLYDPRKKRKGEGPEDHIEGPEQLEPRAELIHGIPVQHQVGALGRSQKRRHQQGKQQKGQKYVPRPR